MVENSQNTIYGRSPFQQAIQQALNNIPTPTETQLSRAANVQFVLDHGGGGEGFLPLNEMNSQKPLTNNLSFVGSQYTLLANQPSQNNAVANKVYTDNLVQSEAISRAQADAVLQQNIDEEQKQRIAEDTTLQSNINTLSSQVWKKYPLFNKQLGTYNAETIDSLISGGSGQSLNQINDQYPLTGNLILTSQPVFVSNPTLNQQPATKFYTDQLVISEAVARTNADNNLQDQIDALDPLIERSLVQINNANSSVGQILNLQGVDVRIDSEPVNLNNPISVQRLSDVLEGYLPSTTKLNQISAPDANVNMANQRITNLQNPINDQDAVNKLYVDEQNQYPLNILNAFYPLTGNLDFLNNDYNLLVKNPTQNSHPSSRQYVDTQIDNERAARQNKDDELQAGLDNRYIKYLTGGNKSNSTYNALQIDAIAANPNIPPLNVIQSTNPLNSYLDLRISNYPTYCVQPSEDDQLANKIYVDNKVSALKLNTIQSPDGSVSFNNQRITDLSPAQNSKDAMNLEQTQQLVTEATSFSLSQINTNYPSTGQILDLTGCLNVKVPEPQNSNDSASLFTVESKIANTKLSDLQPPNTALNFNGQKLSNIGNGQANEDAITVGQVIDTLVDYITIQNANDAFRSRISTLSNIQSEQPANLNMGTYKITNLPLATDPSDAVRFDQLPVINPANEITQGNSFVKVNNNETISLTANNQEVIFIEPTQAVITRALISTSAPPSDVSNAILTKSQLDPYYIASGSSVALIQNSTETAKVTANENQTVQIKAGGVNSSNLTVSCINNNNYTVSASELTLQSSGYLTLNGAQRVQCTTPLLSNSLLDTGSIYQVFNKSQNDDRYYQKIPLNQITAPISDVAMAGNTLTNIRDAVDNLEPTNLAQVTSLIANSGFKAKIQSQSQHAQVICNQPSDTVSIKANNSPATIDISATGSDYTLANTGKINITSQEFTVNNNALNVVGNGGGSTIFLSGDLRSTSADLDLPDQILTRQQNDNRYLVNGARVSDLLPPDTSVSFGNQLLRNLQNPILSSDASTKAYIDNLLPNYVTNEALVAGWLTKSQAATTYRTEQQVDSQISTALIPYSTSSQIASIYLTQNNAAITYITPSATDTKISTALVPYLTQASAQSIYRPLSSPDNKIQSTDGNTQLLANTGSSGISIRANNNQIGTIFQAIGQTGFTPLVIQATDKLQFISNEGSTSFTSGSGDTTNGIYIASNTDNSAQFCWDQLIVGSGTNRQGLVLSSGHTAQNIAYNAISSNTTSNTQSLTITPETSAVAAAGGNQLLMYGNSMASSFPIQNIFNKKTGLSATQSSALANEFLTKGLADTLYTGGGGIQALIRDSGSNNSITCNATSPGIVITNLNNAVTTLDIGSSTSTGIGIGFQSSSGSMGSIVAIGGSNYIEHTASSFGFRFKDNLNNTIAFLKTPARAISEGTKQIIFFDNVQISTDQLTADASDLIQRGYADSRYVFKDTPLQNLTSPSANLSMNNFLITNLASGTIASGNSSSITGGNVYDYIATLPSVITQQVYTVTVFGSTTNGFQFTAFTNTPQNNTVQIQRVKGSGAQMITSSVITSQSQTLLPDFASLQIQVANANVRVTQVVPYTTTAFTTPGQQNIASLTFSQQAINATSSCIQLYKPVSNQGGAAFILYVYVDQF